MQPDDELRGEIESVMLAHAMDYEYLKQLQDCAQAILALPRIKKALAVLGVVENTSPYTFWGDEDEGDVQWATGYNEAYQELRNIASIV